jgi:ribosomal protein S18 acetylase RimI-like enzyme
MMEIRSYRADDFSGVDALWREAFPDYAPRNFAANSIPAKLKVQPDLLLVALADARVIGSVMAGYDGHRGWLYSVAVRKSHRRQGIGAALIGEAEQRLRALGCVKINLQIVETNGAVSRFYEALGYAIEPRISMGKML